MKAIKKKNCVNLSRKNYWKIKGLLPRDWEMQLKIGRFSVVVLRESTGLNKYDDEHLLEKTEISEILGYSNFKT